MRASAATDAAARVRLFVALALPAATRRSLAGWSSDVLSGDESLRLVDSAALHVTLVFLGWRDEHDVERVADVVRLASAGRVAAELRPTRLTALPRRQPRVLAVELEDAEGRAAATQAALSAGLVAAGLHEDERRAFRPHVTVARVRRGGRPPSGRFPDPPAGPAIADEVVLYRSDLSASGARYTPLDVVTLTAEGT